MKVKYPNLHLKMIENKVSIRDLSVISGTSRLALWLKLRGFLAWKSVECVRICVFFRTPDADDLFLQLDSKSQFLESQ